MSDYIKFQVKYKRLLRKYRQKERMKKIYRYMFITLLFILNLILVYVSIPKYQLIMSGGTNTEDTAQIMIDGNLIYIKASNLDVRKIVSNVNFTNIIYVDTRTAVLVVPNNFSGELYIRYGETQRIFTFNNYVKIIDYNVNYYPIVNELNPFSSITLSIRTSGHLDTPSIRVIGMNNVSYTIIPLSFNKYIVHINGIVVSKYVKVIVSAKNLNYDKIINLLYNIRHPSISVKSERIKYVMNATDNMIVIPITIITNNFGQKVIFNITYNGTPVWMNKFDTVEVDFQTSLLLVFRVNESGSYDLNLTFTPVNVNYDPQSIHLTIIKLPLNHTIVYKYDEYIIVKVPENITSIVTFISNNNTYRVILDSGVYVFVNKDYKKVRIIDYFYGEMSYSYLTQL